MKRPIVLIGGGRMGGALLKGWLRNGIGPLVVAEPNPSAELRRLSRLGKFDLHRDAREISMRPKACVIALKPQILKIETALLAPAAQSGALIISVAAGVSISTFAHAWGKGARIIRAMPNMPGAIGRGITALYASRNTTGADRRVTEQLLSALGSTVWVKREALIDSVTAVSGSGPAYVFLLTEALAEAARAEGLPPEQAERLARATVSGAGALLEADRRPASALRQDVTSRGGTTEAALEVLLAQDGLKPLLARAVRAAHLRAKQLSG